MMTLRDIVEIVTHPDALEVVVDFGDDCDNVRCAGMNRISAYQNCEVKTIQMRKDGTLVVTVNGSGEQMALRHDARQTTGIETGPVKHAHWIEQCRIFKREIFKCSNCGHYLDFRGVNAGRGSANYCPNCGSKMDNEDEGGMEHEPVQRH